MRFVRARLNSDGLIIVYLQAWRRNMMFDSRSTVTCRRSWISKFTRYTCGIAMRGCDNFSVTSLILQRNAAPMKRRTCRCGGFQSIRGIETINRCFVFLNWIWSIICFVISLIVWKRTIDSLEMYQQCLSVCRTNIAFGPEIMLKWLKSMPDEEQRQHRSVR